MSEREDGWYWVKPGGHVNFIPAHWDHRRWLVGLSIYEVPIVVQEIGPRIQMPDERPAQEAAPELPVTPQRVREISLILDPIHSKVYSVSALQLATTQLRELADWMARNVK